MKGYIDKYIFVRNTVIILVIIIVVLVMVQKLNRTTISEYFESNDVVIEDMSVQDIKVIYHDMFGKESDDFIVETEEEKKDFMNAFMQLAIRRDYFGEFKYKLFGVYDISNTTQSSSQQLIATGLEDRSSGLRISIVISSGRYVSINWHESTNNAKDNKRHFGYIIGDYFEYIVQ